MGLMELRQTKNVPVTRILFLDWRCRYGSDMDVQGAEGEKIDRLQSIIIHLII
jgi:hypothetical protein